MGDRDFIATIDECTATNVANETARKFPEVLGVGVLSEHGWDVEELIYRAIIGSLAPARQDVIAPGPVRPPMAFDEAKEAVGAGKLVARRGRPMFRALAAAWAGENTEDGYELDNGDGAATGSFRPYDPTPEDRAATGRMEYQPTEQARVDIDED